MLNELTSRDAALLRTNSSHGFALSPFPEGADLGKVTIAINVLLYRPNELLGFLSFFVSLKSL